MPAPDHAVDELNLSQSTNPFAEVGVAERQLSPKLLQRLRLPLALSAVVTAEGPAPRAGDVSCAIACIALTAN